MLYTNNEIDRAYYFTILRTPWGKQAEAGLENGENYFITQRFLHYTEGGFGL